MSALTITVVATDSTGATASAIVVCTIDDVSAGRWPGLGPYLIGAAQ